MGPPDKPGDDDQVGAARYRMPVCAGTGWT